MKYASTVADYIDSKGDWAAGLSLLRELFLSTRLKEEVKWGMPTYTFRKKNVAGFSAFKTYCGIWFFQGVFMKDPAGVLVNAREGITKAQRQWRFASVDQIRENSDLILQYLKEAIRNQEAGLELKPDRHQPLEIPPALAEALESDPSLRDRFDALSPGKQREYADHIRMAKREETRMQRLAKIRPMILEGLGLNDKYK